MAKAPRTHSYGYQRKAKADYVKRKAEDEQRYNRARDPADAFYGKAKWKRVRNWYIHEHPMCESCAARGEVAMGRVVDHIKPIKNGGAPLDHTNLQTLCYSCHNSKTFAEHNPKGRAGKK